MTNFIAEYQSELITVIVGIGFGILLYYFAFYRRRLFFCSNGFSLKSSMSADRGGLRLLYGNDEVNNLTVTTLAFWNGGTKRIFKSSIDPEDEPRIDLNNLSKIYSIEIVKQSDQTNDFSLTHANESLYSMTFDNIGKSQGCVIKILHSGSTSDDISIKGKIKGVGKIKKREQRNYYYLFPISIAIIDLTDGMFFNFGTYSVLTFILTVYGYIILIILSPIFFSNWKNILPEDLYKSFVSED